MTSSLCLRFPAKIFHLHFLKTPKMSGNLWSIPLQTTNFNIVVAFLGGFISIFGLVSYLLKENYYLSEARTFTRPLHKYLLAFLKRISFYSYLSLGRRCIRSSWRRLYSSKGLRWVRWVSRVVRFWPQCYNPQLQPSCSRCAACPCRRAVAE